jgi:hypothetical protein
MIKTNNIAPYRQNDGKTQYAEDRHPRPVRMGQGLIHIELNRQSDFKIRVPEPGAENRHSAVIAVSFSVGLDR